MFDLAGALLLVLLSPILLLLLVLATPLIADPIAIVVPRKGPVTVVRFWRACRDYKHGKDRALPVAEQQLAAAIDMAWR